MRSSVAYAKESPVGDAKDKKIITLTFPKMLKIPSGRNHIGKITTVCSNHSYFGNMWTQVKNKSMKSRTKTNGGSNS